MSIKLSTRSTPRPKNAPMCPCLKEDYAQKKWGLMEVEVFSAPELDLLPSPPYAHYRFHSYLNARERINRLIPKGIFTKSFPFLPFPPLQCDPVRTPRVTIQLTKKPTKNYQISYQKSYHYHGKKYYKKLS